MERSERRKIRGERGASLLAIGALALTLQGCNFDRPNPATVTLAHQRLSIPSQAEEYCKIDPKSASKLLKVFSDVHFRLSQSALANGRLDRAIMNLLEGYIYFHSLMKC